MNLQYLSLAYCTRITDEGFLYLATETLCYGLIYLDLSGCTQVSGNPPLRSACRLPSQSPGACLLSHAGSWLSTEQTSGLKEQEGRR